MSESLLSRSSFVSKLLKNKKFRERYVYEQVRNGIPFQIRALRKKRDWSQADLGEAAGKPRPVISRLEDPNYGKLSLKTLFEIASAFEVALLVKFVPFSRLVKEYEDVSWQVLAAPSVADAEEVAKLEAWSADSAMPKPMTIAANVPSTIQVGSTGTFTMRVISGTASGAIQQTLPYGRPQLVTRTEGTSDGITQKEESDAWQKIALRQ